MTHQAAETFACPECGVEVVALERVPGRHVQCEHCGTLVEVPFFPRVRVRAGGRRKQLEAQYRKLAVFAVGLVVIGVAAAISYRVWRSSTLGRIERDAASELTQARALEHAGQVEEAIARIDHALRSTQDQDSAWIRRSRPDWQNERQRLVRQHLESLLASLDQRAPDDALGVTEEIARWCAGETELQDLANRASVAAQRTRVRRAGEELGKAKDELDRNIFVRVVARLQRVLDDLGTDNDEQANKIRAEVDELVAQASSKRGIVIEPPTGEFLPGLGDSQWYAKSLHEPLRFAASQGGFLPTPDDGRLRTSWDRNARYRVRVHVSEEFGPYFEQSVNPTSRIDVTVQLVREGASQWQHRISARTRIPPVGLTGYEAGYMGIGDKPNPEAVKRLYDDARASLLELLPGRLRTFPRAVEELG